MPRKPLVRRREQRSKVMTQRTNRTGLADATPPLGGVDAIGLQQLRTTFDTTQLLRAVDDLATICAPVADPDELRTDLLLLHGIEIGRAHVRTSVTNAHIVSRLPCEKKQK